MRRQHNLRAGAADAITRAPFPFAGIRGSCISQTKRVSILLVSDDAELGHDLDRAARLGGRKLVRVNSVAQAVQMLRVVRPSVVLLDLDLPAEAAWNTADALLEEQTCPQVILLTAKSEQFDFRTAIRAGSLVHKGTEPDQLLRLVDRALEAPPSAHSERTARQRVMLRWLRPCNWTVSVTSLHRFRGINE